MFKDCSGDTDLGNGTPLTGLLRRMAYVLPYSMNK